MKAHDAKTRAWLALPDHIRSAILSSDPDGRWRCAPYAAEAIALGMVEPRNHPRHYLTTEAMGLRAHAASSGRMITQRERLLVAGILERIVERDIDRRGIRATVDPALHGIDASDLAEFADAMRHCVDGDDLALANEAARGVGGDDT